MKLDDKLFSEDGDEYYVSKVGKKYLYLKSNKNSLEYKVEEVKSGLYKEFSSYVSEYFYSETNLEKIKRMKQCQKLIKEVYLIHCFIYSDNYDEKYQEIKGKLKEAFDIL